MSKKSIIALLILLAAVLLSGSSCSAESADLRCHIQQAVLTHDQHDLLDLLTTPNSEILLFDFVTYEGFNAVEIWLEVYEYGVLIDTFASLQSYTPYATIGNGHLAAIITYNAEQGSYQWMLVIEQEGNRSSGGLIVTPISSSGLARSYGSIPDAIEIQDNIQIVLYMSKFTNGSLGTIPDMQLLTGQPELLAQYTYAHVLIARFSRN